jgi:endonuclease YncB( thermonuclease family)
MNPFSRGARAISRRQMRLNSKPRIIRQLRSAARQRIGSVRLLGLLVIATLIAWRAMGPTEGARHVPAHSAGTIVGYARIIDGDTIEISGTRIRLFGIDAPESTQTCLIDARPYNCGERATLALVDLIRGHMVWCEATGLDRYQRTIARCTMNDNIGINSWLVRQGLAVAYRRYSYEYVPEELLARAAGRGLWAGTFQMPWEYRMDARGETTRRPSR